ncbi:putative uncharacterized protein DDB_G0290521 [Dermacentor silvarum]|uniref:putative uncharacterized protein DDB_G0290521 n=1 Tax=Dermacentor silvarum TaxID=543639 RepID=UPI0021018456|nr:putative uncharacterized protein DDB_G0290521 [Dermacentor silvarum]
MKPQRNEVTTSKENVDVVGTDTGTASMPMDSEAMRATAGSTPPLHFRGSPLRKGKPSKDKKVRTHSKGDKLCSVLSKARSRSKRRSSKVSGSRSVESKKASTPAPSLPVPPPSPSPPKSRKPEALPAGQMPTSSATPSESLVSFSKDASNDDLQLPLLPTRPASSSQKKAPSVPPEVTSSQSAPKEAAMQTPSKQAEDETSSGTQATKPFQMSRTSSVTTRPSPDGSSVSPQVKAREVPDQYAIGPLLDVLVDDLREVTRDIGRRCSSQAGTLEETSVPRLPFSSTTGSAQTTPAAARTSGRPSTPDRGLDFCSFTVGTAASSMLFIVVPVLLQGPTLARVQLQRAKLQRLERFIRSTQLTMPSGNVFPPLRQK